MKMKKKMGKVEERTYQFATNPVYPQPQRRHIETKKDSSKFPVYMMIIYPLLSLKLLIIVEINW